ncbi:Cyanovirin-N [Aspergillus indologenus CBS 114.80]|uniref:Cyanovirin-N n=1 Tax=Aspergillus indologenus CBS 114.80 TaxID=1450541 RepID=A0A2V5HZ47_9EURO|nr:Cyanovirin-N [Aspergillus indologenus CBS 114.80]
MRGLSLFTWTLLSAGTAVQALRGFEDTCSILDLLGTALYADCDAKNGDLVRTSINLNKCLGNVNGNLACRANGNYGKSCYDCVLLSGQLMCTCAGPYGYVLNLYNLNRCIRNENGELVCRTSRREL